MVLRLFREMNDMNKDMNKKGQTNIAWFVVVIGVILIVYIILLPEEEKQKLIAGPQEVGEPRFGYGADGGDGGGIVYPGGQKSLLSESPGTVVPYLQGIIAKKLASVNLFSFTEGSEESLAGSIYISRSIFSNKPKDLVFRIEDVESIEKISLLFFVAEAKGRLRILLNGVEIFFGDVGAEDLPITLPRSLLKNSNRLVFEAESPGLGLLVTNRHELRDVVLFKTFRVENKRESRAFVLSDSEIKGLDVLTLFLFVNCFTVRENGELTIYLNERIIHQGLIVCDAGEVGIDLSLNDLLGGRNVLEFEVDKGKYILEQIVLEGIVNQERFPSYFFTMQVEDMDYVLDGAHVGMDLRFSDDGYRKAATIWMNGFPLYLDTYLGAAFFDLTDYVHDGQNVLRIVPETRFDIVSLEVFLG